AFFDQCTPASVDLAPYSLVPLPLRLSSHAAKRFPFPSLASVCRPSVGAPGTSLMTIPFDQLFPPSTDRHAIRSPSVGRPCACAPSLIVLSVTAVIITASPDSAILGPRWRV